MGGGGVNGSAQNGRAAHISVSVSVCGVFGRFGHLRI